MNRPTSVEFPSGPVGLGVDDFHRVVRRCFWLWFLGASNPAFVSNTDGRILCSWRSSTVHLPKRVQLNQAELSR